MKIYLVGGAVRDQLLKLPVKEKDWVVVGATEDDMLQQGFRPVGKDFPVFLHPVTHEEYALARKERKVGRGYKGFDFDTSKEVTLEEDLLRRDLTMNAIAQTEEGTLVDPFHGAEDIQNRLLKHVSDAFIEDPVRILRVARFSARFAHLGFQVAPETLKLMRKMVFNGEVDALVPERVWKEFETALNEKNPEQFFQVLEDCDALSVLFPELSMESAGMSALFAVTNITSNTSVRFACLLHDLKEEQIKAICERLRVPVEYRELALLVARYFPEFLKGEKLNAAQIYHLLRSVDAFRRGPRFNKFLLACETAFLPHRIAESHLEEPLISNRILACFKKAQEVDAKTYLNQGITGKDLAAQLDLGRIQAIDSVLKNKNGDSGEKESGTTDKKLH